MFRRYEDHRFKSSRAGRHALPATLFAALFCFAALSGRVPFAAALPTAAPKAASLDVRTVTQNGVKWVRSATDIRAVFPLPLDAYKTVLLDVASYPGFVPHLAAVDLFTSPSGLPAMRQRFEVKILGFKFTSIFATTIEPEDSHLPRTWRMAWNFVDSDGTIGAAAGFWELQDVSEGGESRVLVRHVNDGLVRKKLPFQAGIMRSVAERELAASLLRGYNEAIRRWPELGSVKDASTSVDSLPSYRAADSVEKD